MYENATTLELRTGTVNQALRILCNDIAPVLKDQPGLLHLCLLPDRKNSKVTVTSLWTAKARACAVEAVCAYRKVVAKLDPLLAQQSPHPVSATETVKRIYDGIILNGPNYRSHTPLDHRIWPGRCCAFRRFAGRRPGLVGKAGCIPGAPALRRCCLGALANRSRGLMDSTGTLRSILGVACPK